MAINFTDSPANGATITQGNSTFTYNSTYGVWDRSIAASAISVYATLANLPLSDVSDDTIAKVLDTDKLYIWDGSGWYYLPPTNTNPTITTGGDATYSLATDGTATIVTLEANDPEGFPITWGYSVTSGVLGSTAVVSQNNNVFTITPSTTDTHAGSFTITFTASDGVNLSTSASEFTLAFAVDWTTGTQQAKLQASNVSSADTFGQSVSMSSDGNLALVGATGEDTTAGGSGAAYIFTRSSSTWTEQTMLKASDAQANDKFGHSSFLSSDGNTAIIGAYAEDTGAANAGAAYIFTRSGSTWAQQAKITASDKQDGDYFGWSVALSENGNTAIVGAVTEDARGNSAGAAYIFTRSGSTWTEQAKILASNGTTSDRFGESVALSSDGNTAFVGARGKYTSRGAAYIFTRSGSTWTEEAMILSSNGGASDYFGCSISASGDGNTAIIGAQFEDTGDTNAGAAYFFTRSGTTWTEEAMIQASDKALSWHFGHSVSMSNDGNTLIVGAEYSRVGGVQTGAAYLFTRDGTTWTEQSKISASDAESGDEFSRVALSGDGGTAIVGAVGEDTGGGEAGSAYILVAG